MPLPPPSEPSVPFTLPIPAGCNPDCKACEHREISVQASIEQKQNFIRKSLSHCTLPSTFSVTGIAESNRWGTRAKAVLHVRPEVSSDDSPRWKLGLLGARPAFSSWKDPLPLVDLRTCPQHSEKIRSLHQFLENLPVRVSEMDWRFAVISGDLLTLVIKSKELPSPDLLAHLRALKWSRFSLQGVLLNLNASCGNRVLDPKRFHLLWGTSQATATLPHSSSDFVYGPSTFTQVLPDLHLASISAARDFLRSLQPAGVIDLYCGLGLTLREWTALGFPTIGVELSGESVQLAWKNAPNSAEILQGKCEERVPQLNEFLSELSPGPLALYCNPPRMGIADTVLDWILSTTRIEKIAYLSCSPATLGRDLKQLEQNYRIVALQAFDFFPNTRQVETLALLEKAK